jgi:hypothetical protein
MGRYYAADVPVYNAGGEYIMDATPATLRFYLADSFGDVAEPTSLALLGPALAVLGFAARRG